MVQTFGKGMSICVGTLPQPFVCRQSVEMCIRDRVRGFADGTFRPDAKITRAQAITMINRILNRLPEDKDDLLPGMNTWSDCRETDWYYLAIQEATNSHAFQPRDQIHERWTALTLSLIHI